MILLNFTHIFKIIQQKLFEYTSFKVFSIYLMGFLVGLCGVERGGVGTVEKPMKNHAIRPLAGCSPGSKVEKLWFFVVFGGFLRF